MPLKIFLLKLKNEYVQHKYPLIIYCAQETIHEQLRCNQHIECLTDMNRYFGAIMLKMILFIYFFAIKIKKVRYNFEN